MDRGSDPKSGGDGRSAFLPIRRGAESSPSHVSTAGLEVSRNALCTRQYVPVDELLLTAARAGAVYVFMLVVIRALGKRTVGNFSAFDLLVALMLGEMVDEIIYGDVRFIQGAVAIVVIGALAYADAWLSYWDNGMDAVLEGKPTVIIRDGEYDRRGMRAERMNEKEVLGHLRAEGIHDMREVHLAVVENDGGVSVLKHPWAEPAQKADVLEEEDAMRARIVGDRDTPPPEKRTDSWKALGEA